MVIDLVADKTGQKVGLNFEDWPNGVDSIEFRKFKADIKNYEVATGWIPVIRLEQGIKLMISEYLK